MLTVRKQKETCLPAAKIGAGGVLVLDGRQPIFVRGLASTNFILPAGPSEFFVPKNHIPLYLRTVLRFYALKTSTAGQSAMLCPPSSKRGVLPPDFQFSGGVIP